MPSPRRSSRSPATQCSPRLVLRKNNCASLAGSKSPDGIRYKETVSPALVRDFRGSMQGRAEKGLILTTGRFTPDAQKEANRDGVPPIELIDGERLVSLFEKYELGRKGTSKNLAPAAFMASSRAVYTCSPSVILRCSSIGYFVSVSSFRSASSDRTIAACAIRSRFFEVPCSRRPCTNWCRSSR